MLDTEASIAYCLDFLTQNNHYNLQAVEIGLTHEDHGDIILSSINICFYDKTHHLNEEQTPEIGFSLPIDLGVLYSMEDYVAEYNLILAILSELDMIMYERSELLLH